MKKTWEDLFEKLGIDPKIAVNPKARDMLQTVIVDGVLKERLTETEYHEYIGNGNGNLPKEELSENEINRILGLSKTAEIRPPDKIYNNSKETPNGGGIQILENGDVVLQIFGFGREYLPDQVTTAIINSAGENIDISTDIHQYEGDMSFLPNVIRKKETFDSKGHEIAPIKREDNKSDER